MIKLAMVACVLAAVLADEHPPFEVVFEWNSIHYNWPSTSCEKQATITGDYIEANNPLVGIKLWKDKLYLTIPRWKSGVPATLAVTSATPMNGNTAPKLDPYPSWEMQTKGDCNAFQYVQSMEIDPLGRMWVIDVGRTETMTSESTNICPPRLVILDLENDGDVLLSYDFPEEVASRDSSLLNDIVIDHDDGGYAYITDSGTDPGLIVYSLENNTSWKVRHEPSMAINFETIPNVVNGVSLYNGIPVDGIALSPPGPNRTLYYSPLSSFFLHSIPVWVLKDSTITNVDDFVTKVGRKNSTASGMVVTNQGTLYVTLLNNNAIGGWDPSNNTSFTTGLTTVTMDPVIMQWPDTLAIDEEGHVSCVTNRLQNYISDEVNVTELNYRVVRSNTSAKSYQYFKDGTAPDLPAIMQQ